MPVAVISWPILDSANRARDTVASVRTCIAMFQNVASAEGNMDDMPLDSAGLCFEDNSSRSKSDSNSSDEG